MKILITGGNGQLGRALQKLGRNTSHELIAVDVAELDVTSAKAVMDGVAFYKPEAVIHAAAYTNVDKAEEDEAGAYRLNALGTQNVAAACLAHQAKMVYVSTDYVFAGNQDRVYTEFDQPNPFSVYGKTKLAGEMLAAHIVNRLFIVRTSWLYGDGNNFVRTMLKLGKERDELKVVNDQFGCPTFAEDLAGAILSLVETEAYGIYHGANRGITNWYEFAREIFAYAGYDKVQVLTQTTAELGRPAPRPQYAPLGGMMLDLALGREVMRHWKEALREYVAQEIACEK